MASTKTTQEHTQGRDIKEQKRHPVALFLGVPVFKGGLKPLTVIMAYNVVLYHMPSSNNDLLLLLT